MSGAVLLVDDNAVQAATRQAILRLDCVYVFVALSPQRALEQLSGADFPADIKLLITDHIMPGMNGAEFARKVRESHPTLPILVISGLEEAEREYAGCNIVFRTKPLLPEHLLALVHSLLPVTSIDAGNLEPSALSR